MRSRHFATSFGSLQTHVTPGTETIIPHGLLVGGEQGRIPVGYIVIRRSHGASLYPGSTAWTSTNASFSSDVSNARFSVIFF